MPIGPLFLLRMTFHTAVMKRRPFHVHFAASPFRSATAFPLEARTELHTLRLRK